MARLGDPGKSEILKHPEKREQLIDYLKELADPSYQNEIWLSAEKNKGVGYDDFSFVIHFFFDDSALASNTRGDIGYTLRNESEVQSISTVCRLLDELLDKYSTELSDREYLATPEWPLIVEAAREALKVFRVESADN